MGWVILGGIALVAFGGMLTYYADDLNKGWNFERGGWFVFDVVTSIPSSSIKFGFMSGKIIFKESTVKNTQIITKYPEKLFELIYRYNYLNKIALAYERNDALKKVLDYAYSTNNPLLIFTKIGIDWIEGTYIFHPSISQIINYFYNINTNGE